MAHLSIEQEPLRSWTRMDGPRRWLVSAAWTLMVGTSLAAWAIAAWKPDVLWSTRFTDAMWAMGMAFLVIWIAVHRSAAPDLRRSVEAVAAPMFLVPLPVHILLHGGASTMQWLVGAGAPLAFAIIGIVDCFEENSKTARRTRWISWAVLTLLLVTGAVAAVYLWWLEATCAFCI